MIAKLENMVNYSLIYGMAEVRQFLQVDRKFILDSIHYFSEFFSSEAKPDANFVKKFTLNDISVLAYIFTYWEENPDIEYIRLGLNAGDHNEGKFDELIQGIVPVFQEFNDNHLDNPAGVVIGGSVGFLDQFDLAKSYKRSGDELISLAFKNDEKIELFCPAIFCYRHAIELFLKSIVVPKNTNHKLDVLYTAFEKLILKEFKTETPKWFSDLVLALHDFDPGSTTFRYGVVGN